MRKAAALVFIVAMALTVLVVLPVAQAAPGAGGCAVVRIESTNTTTNTCNPYVAPEGATQTGYAVAVTPGARWRIYYEYTNANGQTVQTTVQSQDNSSFGTGTTPCVDSVLTPAGSHWLCAKSITPTGGFRYFAVITSGSGIIELGPQVDLS